MSYKTTITFPIQNISPSETIQLIMEFTHDASGTDRNWTAAEKNLKVVQYGNREMSYDLEDAFMVPGKTQIAIGDPDGVLDNLFFGSDSVALSTDKRAKITKKVNGVEAFIGNIVEDSINPDDVIIKFDALPRTDTINKRMVYDIDGNSLNPFEYSEATAYKITKLLEDIFGLVNPAISYSGGSLDIVHDWKFQGKRDSNTCYLNNFIFSELYMNPGSLYFNNALGVSNCGDILKKLALDWCAFTGMISLNRAFFKKLFHYNETNLQSVDVLKRTKSYRYGLIDYVRVTTSIGSSSNEPYEEGTFTQLEGSYLTRQSLPGYFINSTGAYSEATNIKANLSGSTYYVFALSALTTAPAEDDVYSNNGHQFRVLGSPLYAGNSILYLACISLDGGSPSSSGTLTLVSGTGPASITFTAVETGADGTYDIYQARDPNLFSNAFKDHGALEAKFWYNYRGDIQNCRVDKFILRRITYDFLKDFNYDGSKYQPISMKFRDSEDITECEAIYLGEL